MSSLRATAWRANIVLYAALAANIGIAVAKFIAAAISGSSSMLTEGVHSLVDSGNQVLLLFGQSRANRPPDAKRPFGYGREIYFWSFVVAILIFALGAGVSIFEGWSHYVAPEPLRSPTMNYIVLAVAFAMEGVSWCVAVREFGATKGDDGWWTAIRRSKDPATFTILFEDSAALVGLAIAAIGIYVSHALGDPRIDGIASMLIGGVLAGVAVLLAREAMGLLIGEAASPEVVAAIRAVVDGFPQIVAVNHVRTIHTAPDSIFVAVSADFDDAVTMGEGEALIERIETALKRRLPQLASIYIRPESADRAAIVMPVGTND
ncbi:cation diffusion facilitator family transporter [Sphingomonas donggukensis]|uniref:Cation diffusion facilitator family transporter n=1 Tax=Sphingomonas donggukensis TaxID=2949093 RepID=A0ABY4TYP6_9SPHN|nr:cation diffusion facilitator family transporter [Sphingomonas donggukensis]URW77005.1 cation diffusion facilitator family transporter [Sphingomonas donggukensis]